MEEKYVLITGAYGQVGKALIPMLLEKGYAVFAADIITSDEISDERLMSIQMDATSDRSIYKTFQLINQYTDSLYAIINLVNTFNINSFIEGSEDELRKTLEVNFFSLYKMNKAFMPFIEVSSSRIINVISDFSSLTAVPFLGNYTLSQKMISTYLDTFRRELNYLGIKMVKIESSGFNCNLFDEENKKFDQLIENSELYKTQLSFLKDKMEIEYNKNYHEKIAQKIIKVLSKKNPKVYYKIKRNFKLSLISKLSIHLQDRIFKKKIK